MDGLVFIAILVFVFLIIPMGVCYRVSPVYYSLVQVPCIVFLLTSTVFLLLGYELGFKDGDQGCSPGQVGWLATHGVPLLGLSVLAGIAVVFIPSVIAPRSPEGSGGSAER